MWRFEKFSYILSTKMIRNIVSLSSRMLNRRINCKIISEQGKSVNEK